MGHSTSDRTGETESRAGTVQTQNWVQRTWVLKRSARQEGGFAAT